MDINSTDKKSKSNWKSGYKKEDHITNACENAVELNTIELLAMELIVNINNSVNVEFYGAFLIFLI